MKNHIAHWTTVGFLAMSMTACGTETEITKKLT
jgi:hypothetical protein